MISVLTIQLLLVKDTIASASERTAAMCADTCKYHPGYHTHFLLSKFSCPLPESSIRTPIDFRLIVHSWAVHTCVYNARTHLPLSQGKLPMKLVCSDLLKPANIEHACPLPLAFGAASNENRWHLTTVSGMYLESKPRWKNWAGRHHLDISKLRCWQAVGVSATSNIHSAIANYNDDGEVKRISIYSTFALSNLPLSERCLEQYPLRWDSFVQPSRLHKRLHCFPLNFLRMPFGVDTISPFLNLCSWNNCRLVDI